ncbi:hypothetical protein C4566_02130 [Candidatus Parcubacteria bacterium]|nr:MAG: hypothetical protein C4566_02130 [Candidatus Parcubacteria bacterium]
MKEKNKDKNKFFGLMSKWKLDYLLLFLITGLYFGHIQWNLIVGDPDGFYHTKIALLLRQGIMLEKLPWMQFSTLRDSFTDHHLLYHILLVPFTYINENPLLGIKIATVLFTLLSILVFYWLLKKLHLVWPWLWAVLFITLGGATFRLSLVKANALSLVLVWFFIYALIERKTWLLFILSFVFVWLYGGWPLAILIALIYLMTDKVYKKIHSSKLKIFWQKTIKIFTDPQISNKKIIWAIIFGLTAGLILNPYWPQNIYFYYQQVFQIGIINQGNNFAVGAEWYGTTPMHVVSAIPHLFIISIIVITFGIANFKKMSKQTLFSFALTFVFLLLTIKSRRYIEYMAPFTLLFVACGSSDLIKLIKWEEAKDFWKKLPYILKSYGALLAIVFVVAVLPKTIEKTIAVEFSGKWEVNRFEMASNWLKENSPEKSIVFHTDWDQWPALYYHNDHNYYIVGLDPTFMNNYDEQLHQLYINLTTAEINLNLASKIKENFGAEFILAEKERHKKFVDKLDRDSGAMTVYEDDDVKIYKIR